MARVFISHILRFEYSKAAVYADDSTAWRLRKAEEELDTSWALLKESRKYQQKFSIQRPMTDNRGIQLKWCCHADGTEDSLFLYFFKGRWRVKWTFYQPSLSEEKDTIYKVEYIY
ncbi:MAG: hypothetical protein N2050_02815 [Flavobacteriales bacterium]|nr:hypothetical protein [Flavobacteriales bacterium]MCX7649472.1 hypothetical protein [Flavobacteriales bacterium]MDW8431823.1 hypothetical protein [Flavobacteriales bacterium]